MGELLEVLIDNVAENLLHLFVVADELTLRHSHLPRVRAHGVGVPGFLVGSEMGAHGYGEIAALVVERGVREVGGEDDGHSAHDSAYRAAHGAGDYQNRPFAALIELAYLGGDPLLAKEALFAEIVVEHLREFDAGIA